MNINPHPLMTGGATELFSHFPVDSFRHPHACMIKGMATESIFLPCAIESLYFPGPFYAMPAHVQICLDSVKPISDV